MTKLSSIKQIEIPLMMSKEEVKANYVLKARSENFEKKKKLLSKLFYMFFSHTSIFGFCFPSVVPKHAVLMAEISKSKLINKKSPLPHQIILVISLLLVTCLQLT